MEKDVVICPNCEEFIGRIDGLDVCPICGANLIGKSSEDE